MKTSVIFFGSTTDSVIVLESLYNLQQITDNLRIACVVTQPARPVGRKQEFIATPVAMWANAHAITVLSFATNAQKPWLFEDESQVIDTLTPFSPDLVLSASYGQKIPSTIINIARHGSINIHPSLIPRWRGADPVPWSLLADDHHTGVTLMTLSEKFDEGRIVEQKKLVITDTDFADPLRTKLFTIGAELLTKYLPVYLAGNNKGKPQKQQNATYASKFSRQDGYIPWEILTFALGGEAVDEKIFLQHTNQSLIQKLQKVGKLDELQKTPAITLERTFRALHPWPGLWTTVPLVQKDSRNIEEKRLKILSCQLELGTPSWEIRTNNLARNTQHLALTSVQLEGKKPVSFQQFLQAYNIVLNR